MRFILRASLLVLAIASVHVLDAEASGGSVVSGGPAVDYQRDVEPILSDRCYACHGPDANARQVDLRFDVRESAVDYGAIVPGEPGESLLVDRVAAEDPEERMPPPESNKPALTPAQVQTLRHWIAQGAPYHKHWAYVPPVRPSVPKVANRAWVANPIDAFVARAHEKHGLKPSPEADRRTLLRRLAFHLVGLPLHPEEVESFAAASSADAYGKQVKRLLASPHFGERMAVYWLDVVRYADSGGYHSDNARSVWMYRDYVIRSFNENKPFDKFLIEQLAGDLLPEPSEEQKVASGYNRLLQTTEEGGAQPKEYTAKYAADRTRNTAAAFLGATLGCAQCHDHKFDPFTTRDFYSFAAFFADVKEKPVGRQEETTFPTPEQAVALERLVAQIASLNQEIEKQTPELDAALAEWEKQIAADAEAQKELPKPVADVLAIEPGKRTESQTRKLAAHFRQVTPLLQAERAQLASLESKRQALDKEILRTLISEAVAPRIVRILPRGNWMDDSGEVVEPAVPAFLGRLDVGDRRATRLDLARWMAARDQPLVARVFVNRLWKLFFGRGIVASLDDFGSQGALPTHPELLDWLAVELIESGWDVKHVVRLIVTSNTYRQSSNASSELRGRDPTNQWLARQNSFRLDAEFVRDNALAVSGLLVPRIGGPSVKPYQPVGYWQHLNFPKRTWEPDRGENQYRRGLYTWWQRTFLHPSLAAFDASSREQCTVDRPRSNTPLQALALLNDPTYVEAARNFAERILREGGDATRGRIAFAYREALGRKPRPSEAELIEALLDRQRGDESEPSPDAGEILHVGFSKPDPKLDAGELIAWTAVARVILNLHETITRY